MIMWALTWILSAIFVRTDKLPGIADLPDAPQRLREMTRSAPWAFVLPLYGAIVAFMVLPLLTIGWPLPAFLLPQSALQRHIERMSHHPIYLVRQTFLMLRTVGGLVWGGHPAVRKALDMPVYGEDSGTFRDGSETWQALKQAGQPLQ